MAFLKILRPLNLFFIAWVQVLLKYTLFDFYGASTWLTDFQFALLILATLLIAAGGYVINDIYDVEIDQINKPQKQLVGKAIPSKTALIYYMVLTSMGVAIGFYLSNLIGRPAFATIFVFAAALLYLYSSQLKSWMLIGNIIISLLVGLPLLLVGIFELLPAMTEANQPFQQSAFKTLLEYAGFAFLINLIREIIKDIEDIDGDKNGGMNTLPIALGRSRASNIALGLGIIAIALVIYYLNYKWYSNKWMLAYFLVLVVGPLLYFCNRTYNAEKKEDYSKISGLLKVVLFTGMCSMLVFPFIES